jgi:hypothetical protein
MEEVEERLEKLENKVKVIQLMMKDKPRKSKEDDPHYKPYKEFREIQSGEKVSNDARSDLTVDKFVQKM